MLAQNFIIAEPDLLETTNAYVATAPLDASNWRSVAYTIHNEVTDEDSAGEPVGNSLKWEVFAANASDYSDEVIVKSEATVLLDANDAYAVTQAPYRYYRAKIKDATGGQHATALIRGIAKA